MWKLLLLKVGNPPEWLEICTCKNHLEPSPSGQPFFICGVVGGHQKHSLLFLVFRNMDGELTSLLPREGWLAGPKSWDFKGQNRPKDSGKIWSLSRVTPVSRELLFGCFQKQCPGSCWESEARVRLARSSEPSQRSQRSHSFWSGRSFVKEPGRNGSGGGAGVGANTASQTGGEGKPGDKVSGTLVREAS